MQKIISIQNFIQTAQEGFKTLPTERRDALGRFIYKKKLADDSYMDRNGNSDLYYSYFGIICEIAAGANIDSLKSNFLDKVNPAELKDLPHLSAFLQINSILRSNRKVRNPQKTAESKETEKLISDFISRDTGLFCLYPGANPSIYGTYLAVCALNSMNIPIKAAGRTLLSLEKFKMQDGFYSNDCVIPYGIATATSAALLLKKDLNSDSEIQLPPSFSKCHLPTGGFILSPNAKFADLLSTSTVLFSMTYLSGNILCDRHSHINFVLSLQRDDGGFCASEFDNSSDIEYCFYALLAIGALCNL